MPRVLYNNTFAAAGANLDLQRADLFKVTINLPAALQKNWAESVEFAVEQFPFPDRDRESIAIKYLQQTNHAIGGDAATGPIVIPVRYAFAQDTLEALERWHSLIANQRTGGVGLTSQVKSNGLFKWLVPNMPQQQSDAVAATPVSRSNTLRTGVIYRLVGCWIKSLKFDDANMTTGTEHANVQFSLMVDRWYPDDNSALIVAS